jgi:hypothetical protein
MAFIDDVDHWIVDLGIQESETIVTVNGDAERSQFVHLLDRHFVDGVFAMDEAKKVRIFREQFGLGFRPVGVVIKRIAIHDFLNLHFGYNFFHFRHAGWLRQAQCR